MARTKLITLYQFAELSEDAKRHALDSNREWNVEYIDWWDFTYDDAEQIGLNITGFDDYHVTGKLTGTTLETIEKILADHGPDCKTYKLAERYKPLIIAKEIELRCQGDETGEDDPELADEFLKTLLRCYKNLLDEEYEHLTSDEAIIDSFEANETEFNEDGSLA